MAVDPRTESLVKRMIATERAARGTPLRDTLQLAQGEAAEHGRLGAGFYASAQEKTCGEELETRAKQWLAIAMRAIDESGAAWTTIIAEEVNTLLRNELQADWDQILDRYQAATKPHGHDRRFGHLDGSLTRAHDRITQELELRVIHQDRSAIPVLEQLQSPRYAAVRVSWIKANDFLQAAALDPENAAKEAVAAVEALARSLVGDPAATLGDVIKTLRATGRVSAPLLKGLEELWGYTSNAQSVRHGGGSGPPVTVPEARYALDSAAAAIRLLLQLDAA